MPDTVPAPRVAAVALDRLTGAIEKLREVSPQSYHRKPYDDGMTALSIARELLALIADHPAPQMVNVRPDEVVEPLLPPSPPAPAPSAPLDYLDT